MSGIQIKDLSFAYEAGGKLILKDINTEIGEGEFVCILGQSGCGKSTLLRLLAGLETATTGEILSDGVAIGEPSLNKGVVFQDYGLFPWMSAGENILLALKQRYPKRDKKELKEIAVNMIKAVGLDESIYKKLPKELSGGMKQRCAIAQAFSIDPPILLMDALMGTQNNYGVKQLVDSGDIEIVSYQSEIMENYSCCRMVGQTKWVNDNPDTVKAIIRALLRAQSWYEANKEEAVSLHAKRIGQEDDYVAAYMMDDKHYFVNVDPLKNSVVRAWNILDKTGYLGDDCKIDIEDHINTELYEEALAEATKSYGDEAPDFYEAQQKFFDENDK